MVDINTFKITDNGTYINVDASVKSGEAYANVYLKSMWIDTLETFTLGSSESAIYLKDLSSTTTTTTDITSTGSIGFAGMDTIPLSDINVGDEYSYALSTSIGSVNVESVEAEDTVVITPDSEDYVGVVFRLVTTNGTVDAATKLKVVSVGLNAFSADVEGDYVIIAYNNTVGAPVANSYITKTQLIHTTVTYPKTFTDAISIGKIGITPVSEYGASLSDFKSDLFFVTFETTGAITGNVPCGEDEIYTIAVTYYRYPILEQAMNMLRELDGCEPPQNLINWFLRVKMIDISIEAGYYTLAALYWKDLMLNSKNDGITHKCGCHGR